MSDDDLADFEETTFTADVASLPVFRMGEGPAVLVMAELPGITPRVADFGRRVAGIGCTAVLPAIHANALAV